MMILRINVIEHFNAERSIEGILHNVRKGKRWHMFFVIFAREQSRNKEMFRKRAHEMEENI